MVLKFASKPVFRILVNTPSTQGGVGASTGLAPAFTLGCGTWGGSSTSDNVSPMHLLNIKRVAYGIKDVTGDKMDSRTECRLNSFSLNESQVARVVEDVMRALKKGGV